MNHNKARATIVISGKVDFRERNITRDRKGYLIKIKEKSHQEDIIHLNIYALKNRALKYMKQNLV